MVGIPVPVPSSPAAVPSRALPSLAAAPEEKQSGSGVAGRAGLRRPLPCFAPASVTDVTLLASCPAGALRPRPRRCRRGPPPWSEPCGGASTSAGNTAGCSRSTPARAARHRRCHADDGDPHRVSAVTQPRHRWEPPVGWSEGLLPLPRQPCEEPAAAAPLLFAQLSFPGGAAPPAPAHAAAAGSYGTTT